MSSSARTRSSGGDRGCGRRPSELLGAELLCAPCAPRNFGQVELHRPLANAVTKSPWCWHSDDGRRTDLLCFLPLRSVDIEEPKGSKGLECSTANCLAKEANDIEFFRGDSLRYAFRHHSIFWVTQTPVFLLQRHVHDVLPNGGQHTRVPLASSCLSCPRIRSEFVSGYVESSLQRLQSGWSLYPTCSHFCP